MKIKLLIVIWTFSLLANAIAAHCSQEKKGFEEGMSYFKEAHYLLASQLFSQLRIYGDESCGYSYDAAYFQSAAYLELEDVRAFEISMQRLQTYSASGPQNDRLRLLRAYAYKTPELTNVDSDLKRRWNLWLKREETKLSDLGSPELNRSHELYVQTKTTKRPWIAGTLSAILPGAGQAYVGSYQAAALSFMFNALLLGATLEFNRKDMDFAAATSGVMFSMTYLGNIASAVKGASQINEAASEGHEVVLRQGLLPELQF